MRERRAVCLFAGQPRRGFSGYRPAVCPEAAGCLFTARCSGRFAGFLNRHPVGVVSAVICFGRCGGSGGSTKMWQAPSDRRESYGVPLTSGHHIGNIAGVLAGYYIVLVLYNIYAILFFPGVFILR